MVSKNINDEKMVEFVKTFIESHDPIGTGLDERFPFRRRFEHCLRCSIWARQIALAESADAEIAGISALFHDIGKSIDKTKQGHGRLGAQICDDYLKSIAYDENKRSQIVRIVRDHSQHFGEDAALEAKIMRDADALDETGAIAVLWDVMACAGEDAPSYEKAYERIVADYDRLRDGLRDRLFTPTAKQILTERLSFIEIFLKNLEKELGRSENLLFP
jgi:putative nucleotidyltransferase with HDIG domain